MTVIVVVLAWLAFGAAVGLIQGRRGHWHKSWVLSALLGPLAIPYGQQAHRRAASMPPVTLDVGQHRAGGLSVLVGVDGSDSSQDAALTAAKLFADRIGRLTLATVLDFDTAASTDGDPLYPEKDWPERIQAKAELAALADDLEAAHGLRPHTVLLAGDPSRALEAYAVEGGHDLVVVGTRGHGMTEVLFGSCASGLGHQHDGVPVLLVSSPPNPGHQGDPDAAKLE